jgi:outer membrane autotransporter protein
VDTTVTPYIGVRRSTLKVDSYTKSGELFPLTYGSVVQKQNDLLFGGTFSKRLTDDLTGSLSAGVIHGLMRDSGTVSVTSDMGAYSARMRDAKRTAGSLGAGLTYKLDKSSSIGINTGWTQRGLTDASVTTYSIGYTAGF